MDSDRVEGTASDLKGKVKDAVGGLTGDSKTQAEGKADQLSGKVQRGYGQVKDAAQGYADSAQEMAGTLGEQLDTAMKEKPLAALLIAGGVGYVLSYLLHRR